MHELRSVNEMVKLNPMADVMEYKSSWAEAPKVQDDAEGLPHYQENRVQHGPTSMQACAHLPVPGHLVYSAYKSVGAVSGSADSKPVNGKRVKLRRQVGEGRLPLNVDSPVHFMISFTPFRRCPFGSFLHVLAPRGRPLRIWRSPPIVTVSANLPG